jgi:acyl carrier protein
VPNEDEIRTRLTQVFHEVFDDDTIVIKDETTADDIDEWDSLSHISLVLATEKEFGVRLKAAEVGNLADVGAMIRLLVERATR